jgi:hypothetical protein
MNIDHGRTQNNSNVSASNDKQSLGTNLLDQELFMKHGDRTRVNTLTFHERGISPQI